MLEKSKKAKKVARGKKKAAKRLKRHLPIWLTILGACLSDANGLVNLIEHLSKLVH